MAGVSGRRLGRSFSQNEIFWLDAMHDDGDDDGDAGGMHRIVAGYDTDTTHIMAG